MTDAAEQSKRAEKRARQKANKAAAAAGEAPATAAPTPKPDTSGGYPAGAKAKAAAAPPVAAAPAAPKAKAKAQAAPEPEPKAKAKAKAKGQAAEPKAEPKAAAQPKGKAAAAPAPKAKAAAAPAPEAPKAKATQPAAKAKQAGGKKEEKEEPRVPVERIEEMRPVVVDDGIGEWEVSANASKKKQKQQERQAQQAAAAEAQKAAAQAARVPGMGPTGPAVNSIPGMEPTKAEKKAAAAAAKAAAAAPVAVPAAAAPVTEEAPAAKPGSIVTINVPENKIGRIIGPKGATLKMLQEKTGVTRIDTSGEMFTIIGEPKDVAMAETAMREMIEKGYMSITFDNFSEDSVQVHPSAFPDLIGKQGAIIRKIKEELKAEVEIPPVPKNGHPAKKYKVTIAGSKDAVVKAKEVINSIMMYYHHELTHPGEVHEEIEVVDWQLRFVIGKGGSEMRHIQSNFKVKVYVPREHSMNQMTVIVGERVNVDRAKTYIEKMLWNAEHAPKGRDKAEGVGDDYHEEETQEPWMDQYMFKRRR